MMTPRERVVAALAHKEPDRVPIDLGATLATSITSAAYVPLRAHLGLPAEDVTIFEQTQQLPYLGEDLLVRLGVDTRVVAAPRERAFRPTLRDEGEYWAWIDAWGAKLRMPKDGGLYYDWVEHPLPDVTVEAIDAYRWPELETADELGAIRDEAIRLRRDTDFALVGSANLGSGIFEQACLMAGMEAFMMAMVSDRPTAERLLDGITDFLVEEARGYLDQLGDHLDAYLYGDDVATQETWMISPESYATMIKPRQRRLFDAIKAGTNAKLIYHGCGAVFDLIPHLIEIGVDAVNPVQVSARGMDTARLKAAYGHDIAFWGGGVDTQRVLPFGSPDDVRAEVRRRVADLSPGGGFVFAPVHNIQAFVPPENIVAAFDAVRGSGSPSWSVETRVAPGAARQTLERT
jgi:uroporphyrinogen decarboxylase